MEYPWLHNIESFQNWSFMQILFSFFDFITYPKEKGINYLESWDITRIAWITQIHAKIIM